jgi:hypothetical protein
VTADSYRDGSGRLIRLGEPLGAGGEGTVFTLRDDARFCAKIYHPHEALERSEKLRAMVASQPSWLARRALSWPTDLLFRDEGPCAFAGFLMRAQRRMPELYRLLVPDERLQIAGFLTARDLCRLAAAVAGVVARIHREGHCVGDLKPANILVDPLSRRVVWIDTDSFQVQDRTSRRVHRSAVVTPEYTAPELFADPARTPRTPASDAFALAVLIHQILLGGAHPFDGDLLVAQASLERIPGRIRRGVCPLIPGVTAIRPAASALAASTLHPELRALFVRCFGAGQGRPEARPAPADWQKALLVASRSMIRCRSSAAHLHDATLARCPWCERRERTGLDLFPGGQQWQRALVRSANPAREPEHRRTRWLSRHARARSRTGAFTKTERAWLLKTGAALGLDRELVTKTLEASLRPPFDARQHAAALLSRLRVALSSLHLERPRLRLEPRRTTIVLVTAASLISVVVVAAIGMPVVSKVPTNTPPEPRGSPSRLCVRATQRAVIGNTQGQGAYLRAAPSTTSAKLSLPDGTTVRLTGRTRSGNPLAWTEVEVEHLKRVGWVATRYLEEPRSLLQEAYGR